MNPLLSLPNPKLQFYKELQKIAQEITSDIVLLLIQGDLNEKPLLSKNQISLFDPDTTLLVKKVHEMALAQLQQLLPVEILEKTSEGDFLFIPQSHLKRFQGNAQNLKSISDVEWGKFSQTKKTLKPILEFVSHFNEQFYELGALREDALELIEQLKRGSWEYDKRVPKVPKASEVSAARNGFYQMFRCNDPLIKEVSLIYLTELMEWDPLHMETAFHLIDLQSALLEEIKAQRAQDLNTNLQRRLIKAYAISVECVLLHAGAGHLNAMTDQTKQDNWAGAEELAALNVSNDPEIKFWSCYAIQGIQHIRSDKSTLMNVLGRLALIARAGIQIAASINKPEEAASSLTGAFNDLKEAFTHIEWHANWFEELLLLKKLCRFSILNPIMFRKLSPLIKDKKSYQSSKRLLYGVVSILEYTILNSPSKEIREEGLKLLLQYLSIDHTNIQRRILNAFDKIINSEDPYLKQTGHVIKKLLAAAGKIPTNYGDKRIKVSKKYIYENVLKFLLLKLGGIKGGYDMSGQSLVTILCHSEDANVVFPLLKCLAVLSQDFQEPDLWGNTLYHLLVRLGNVALIRCMDSEMSININAQEYERQYTALHDAVMTESKEGIAVLLELKANPNLPDKEGNAPLHLAVLLDKDLVTLLIDGGSNPNLINHLGKTPLNLAIEAGNGEMILYLISKGAKIAEDAQSITPLMLAAKLRNRNSLEVLIKEKEKLNRQEALEIARFISGINKSDPFTLFHEKHIQENVEYNKVFALLGKGKRFERFGNTKLMALAKGGDIQLLQEEIRNGSNFNEANCFGQTALHLAVLSKNKWGVETLAGAGVKLEARDVNGFTPLHLAAYVGDINIVNILLKYGADYKSKNDFGETPFIVCCGVLPLRHPKSTDILQPPSPVKTKSKGLEIMQKLISAGTDVSERDPLGNNGLHRACFTGLKSVIYWLIQHYPHLMWARNLQGQIPVEIAILNKRKLDSEWLKSGRLAHLHKQFVEMTNNRLSLGKLLVSAGESEVFRTLVAKKNRLAYHTDAHPMKDNPLHLAAKLGNCDVLRIYTDLGLDINQCNAGGNNPGHLAVYYDQPRFLKKFKASGGNLLAKNRDGRTPLHLSATKQNLDAIHAIAVERLLLEVDNRGDTPLHIACRYGILAVVEALWIPHAQMNDDGNTPMHEAALHGREHIVRFLIQKSEDVEARNSFGQTPMMLAAQEGHAMVVSLLLNIGANVWAQDEEGETVLHKAVFNHHLEVVQTLLQGEKQLICPKNERLVERVDLNKDLPLHGLGRRSPPIPGKGSVSILHQLLEAGADPKAPNERGETFLHIISFYGRNELFQALTEKRKHLEFAGIDLHKNTPLHHAVLGKQAAMVVSLSLLKAGIEEKNDEGLTPLMLAVAHGFWEGARILIESKANPYHRTSEGRNILHSLLSRKKLAREDYGFLVDLVQTYPDLLLGVDIRGRTPFHELAENGHVQGFFVLRFLPGTPKARQEYYYAKDVEGNTAFDLAEENNHKKLARTIRTSYPESLGADYKERRKPFKRSLDGGKR